MSTATREEARGRDTGALQWFLGAAQRAREEGDWEEALTRYETSLRRVPTEGDARVAAEILRGIGNVHYAVGDLDQAADVFDASLAIADANDLREQRAAALNCSAVVEQYRTGPEAAEALYRRAGEEAAAIGDESLAALIDQNLGTIATIQGDTDGALFAFRSALRFFRRRGDNVQAARILNNIGMAQLDVEDCEAAEHSFAEAHDLATFEADSDTLAAVEVNLCELHLRRGELEDARAACDRAFELFSRMGSKAGMAEAFKFYGAIHRESGDLATAERYCALAIELAGVCNDRLLEAESERERAELQMRAGRDRETLRSLGRAHRLFNELRARRDLLDIERRIQRLEEAYLDVVHRWAEAVEARDRFAKGHAHRVADYACRLAERCGLGRDEIARLRVGALLHDIGTIGIPESVLNTAAKLKPREYERMRSHAELGESLLAELDLPWDVRSLVRNHHERWDGHGYPDGLAGEQIPVEVRILSVAEHYDALTSERSYRPANTPEQALEILREEAGSALDPELVDRFQEMLMGEPRAS